MKNQNSILQTLVFVLSPFLFFGQNNYFPGGLGNSNLKIWLNASNNASLTYNGSNQVSQWYDLSNNGFDFSQITSANQPIYTATGGPNSRPAINFTRSNSHFLSTPLLPGALSFTSGVSTFSVANFSSNGNYERIYDFGNANESDNLIAGRYGVSANFFYEVWAGNSGAQTYTSTNPIVNGTPSIYEAIQQGGVAGSNTAVSFYSAGSSQTSGGTFGSQTRVPAATNRTLNYVGRSNWLADDYFDGSISEIIFYNSALNNTQRIIVENYLSASWGMAISSSNFTPPTSTTYNKNLIGIGYTSISDNVLSNPAGSTDGFGLSSGTGAGDFLNTTGYLMAAHNGQFNSLLSNQNISGVSTPDVSRMNRSWYLQKSGGNATGNVTLSFNFGDYNGTGLPAGAISFGLIYHPTNGDFSSGSTTLITNNFTFAGSQINFLVPASSISNGYYSIVWSNIFTLPVKLKDFKAEKNKSSVILSWLMTDQDNLSHFVVERSSDGRNYNSLTKVSQLIKSPMEVSYDFEDKYPVPGLNYYRLKIVDNEGTATYSPVRMISVDGSANKDRIKITPIPGSSLIQVNFGEPVGNVKLRIVNASGQTIWSANRSVNGTERINVAFLSKGLYFLAIDTQGGSFTKKFIKE